MVRMKRTMIGAVQMVVGRAMLSCFSWACLVAKVLVTGSVSFGLNCEGLIEELVGLQDTMFRVPDICLRHTAARYTLNAGLWFMLAENPSAL